nr:uncharacterized protein LOC122587217 isoform X2 [Erigeron canadensis]XP_043615260.1 uncharacterized protein LOC122587217 isoform X2 [Erigeron canadensis]XP_043615261.1 uncharacterized protein LOC122587217 isoform X2 [Erigeron canadensis]
MWFIGLPPRSISSFEQLVESFRTKFLHNVKFQKPTNETVNMTQQISHNSVDEFVERSIEFQKTVPTDKQDLSMRQLLSLFINWIEPDRVVKDFSTKNDPAMEDLLNGARSFTILDAVHIKLPETETFIEALPRSAYSYACILEFHGALKGNPGRAGAGVVLRAIDGCLVYRVRGGLGNATPQVAEYQAVILGLRYALKKGFRHICVHGDSKIVYMQVNSLWKAKSQNMVDMCKVVKELKEKFLSFQICHIDREKNFEADTQANLGLLLKEGEVEEEVEKI